MSVLRSAKLALLRASRSSSLYRVAAASRWRSSRLLILCYHGVALEDEHQWQSNTFISAPDLESRLRYLRDEKYAVLPLGEGIRRLTTGSLPPRSVVITFDDGFYNFKERAWPLLQNYGFPATLYLTTFYSTYNRPIFRLCCSYMLWRNRDKTIGPDASLGIPHAMSLATRWDRELVLRLLTRYAAANDSSAADKDALAQGLARILGFDFEWLLRRRLLHLMKPDEVAELAVKGLDVQLHTHRHRTPLDRDLFQKEIRDNRNWILDCTGKDPVHFCYPSGQCQRVFFPWLSEMRVATATTCQPAFATSASNPLMLPRYLDGSDKPLVEVEGWLTGFATLLPRKSFEPPMQ